MAKSKGRKSETIKPPIQDDGFISKNKKRKEKRHSLNLAAKKMDTNEFIPVKRTSLFIAQNAKTPEKSKLLPFNNKQKTPNQNTKGILKNTPNTKNATATKNNTPNPKGTPNKAKNTPKSLIKETLKRKAEELIDNEASEGEEPITDKVVKPYEKSRKKSISFLPHQESDEDSDDEPNAAEFVDFEASEGEETDDEDDESDDDDDDDDDEDDDASLTGEQSSGSEEEDDDDDEEDEEEEESSDNEVLSALPSKQQKKLVSAEPKKVKKKPGAVTNQKVKKEPAAVTNQKVKKEPGVATNEKMKKEPVSESNKKEKSKTEKQKPQSQPEKKPKPSEHALFIRNVPKTVTEDEIKSALATKLDSSKILEIVQIPKSSVNCYLVYVTEKHDLDSILHVEFAIGTFKFIPLKARESANYKENNFKVFFPRVPVSVSDEVLKKLVEDLIGSGKVMSVRSFRVVPKFQTRNIIIELSNKEDLEKVVVKSRFEHDGSVVIARQAEESACKLTIHKVVFSNVPEKITDETLKKEIENVIGKNTVENVVFSLKNHAFSFVTFKNETAKTKALDLNDKFVIQGVTLQVKDFVPRAPLKRGRSRKKEGLSKKRKIEANNTTQPEGAGKKKKDSSKPAQKNSIENSKKKMKTEPQLNGKTNESTDISPKNKKKKKKNKPTENVEKVVVKTEPGVQNQEVTKKKRRKKAKVNSLQNGKSEA